MPDSIISNLPAATLPLAGTEPTVAALGPALGLTAEQIDDLFRSAVTL
jgi:hypothetical protein